MALSILVEEIVKNNEKNLLSKKSSWIRIKVKEIAKLLNGYPFDSKCFVNSNEVGFPLIRIRDIHNINTEARYNGEYNPEFVVRHGDILIGMDGDFELDIWKGNPALLNQRVCKVIIDEKKYNKKFFFYVMPGYLEAIHRRTSSVTVKHLSSFTILDTPLPLPSLPEQSLIVAEIEKQFTRFDASVKSLKAVKQKLEIYRKAVLKKAFEKKEGWEEKRISDVFHINPSKSEIKDLDENIEVSFIPMAYVSEKGKIVSMDKRKLKDVKKGFTYFKNKDVLLAKITPCFENGKKAFAEDLMNGIGFGTTEFYVLREMGEVIPEWVYYNLSREDFRSGAKRSMGGAVGQQRVSKDFIENFNLSFPKSKEEQTIIVQEIESKFSVIDKIEQVVNESLEKTEKLRKSILKSAFEGKLVKEIKNEN